MTRFEHYLSGSVFGIKYVFDTAEDGLPWHAHTDLDAHNVCVLNGHVNVVFATETVYLGAGDLYDFDGSRRHSIQALTPGAMILNLFRNGQPEAYRTLPESELKGEFDVRDFKT
jgi:mannose-6-phosphate isomerase-like protein (cupin superfamily)